MSLNVTIEAAYAEACQALGESIVIQRLQAAELLRLAEVAEPEPEPAPPKPAAKKPKAT